MADGIVASVEYREIPEFVGYRFGSDGSVWSRWVGKAYSDGHCRIRRTSALGNEWRCLKPIVNPASGYCQVRLKTTMNGQEKYKTYRLHPLILRAFRGPRPSPAHDGCHNNGIKTDNALLNLRWDTKIANSNDRRVHGTHLDGERLSWTRLTASQVAEIRKSSDHPAVLASRFGVSRSCIDCVVARRTWKHLEASA